MAPELKTEVVKLGEKMSQEERSTLETILEQVKAGPEPEAQPAPAEPEPAEPEPCSRCGYLPGDEAPPEEDLQEYMRSVLGGRRFSKTYELMRGQIKLTFTSVDAAASERINSIVTKLGVLEDPVQFRVYATKLNLVYMLVGMQLGSDVNKFETATAATPEDVDAVFKERFGALDESVLQMCTRALNTFTALKNALINASFDETFYKGAGPF